MTLECVSRHESIHDDPSVLAGKPVIRGIRLSVEFLLGLLSEGDWSSGFTNWEARGGAGESGKGSP